MMVTMRWVLTLWLFIGCGSDEDAASEGAAQSDAEDTAGQRDTGSAGFLADCEDAADVTWDNWGQSSWAEASSPPGYFQADYSHPPAPAGRGYLPPPPPPSQYQPQSFLSQYSGGGYQAGYSQYGAGKYGTHFSR